MAALIWKHIHTSEEQRFRKGVKKKPSPWDGGRDDAVIKKKDAPKPAFQSLLFRTPNSIWIFQQHRDLT